MIKRTDRDYTGLFGYLTGTVKNLKIKNSEIEGRECVGTVAGYLDGKITKNKWN